MINWKRIRPDAVFSSFLGVLDIKLGCEIILLFGLINKVGGLYGLITVFVGGSFAQLLFYGYSTASLFTFLWALQVVKSETSTPTILVAHLYTLDHLIQTLFHFVFYEHYWYGIPHDGRRTANSQAQLDLINLAASRGEILDPSSQDSEGLDELRAALAGEIWSKEKVYAVWILIGGFFLKMYFILILYSYAEHLRSSTYHALPLTSRSKATQIAHPTTEDDLSAELEHEDLAEGASNGDAGKGNTIVGNKDEEDHDEDDSDWD